MSLFIAEEITKRFANHTALTKLSISVPQQSIFGLLGPNGAGKTTLIRIINQITVQDSGKLFFNGNKLNQSHISNIGYLPEERGLYKKMKVGEQVLYLAQLKGLNKHEAIKRLKYWFEKFDIGAWWNRKVEELSKGMQQKIQFIITILHEPELLIFDEPFSGFDPINVNLLKSEILKLRDNGTTIIFSTHNMESVEELCDNIALINNSRKILDGEVQEVKSRFKSNVFELIYSTHTHTISNILNDKFVLLENHNAKESSQAKIKIKEGTPNDLLSLLIPHTQILSFNEVIPSMNDIFIQRVAESDKSNNEGHE
jgi:ABC-2 type transport system ATP-binding protein